MDSPRLLWLKGGKVQTEQMSCLHLKADARQLAQEKEPQVAQGCTA
jgi:hypothetical protein